MKNRAKLIIVLAAALALTGLIILPGIIEAKLFTSATTEKNSPTAAALPIGVVQNRREDVVVGQSTRNDTSIPLREMKQKPMDFSPKRVANRNPKVPHSHKDAHDPVVQRTVTGPDLFTPNMPTTDQNFNGIQFPGVACNCAPPDTVGEVGATQYVQLVNEGFQVFNKTTGASLLGPSGIQTIWQGFGGVCETNGSGDRTLSLLALRRN